MLGDRVGRDPCCTCGEARYLRGIDSTAVKIGCLRLRPLHMDARATTVADDPRCLDHLVVSHNANGVRAEYIRAARASDYKAPHFDLCQSKRPWISQAYVAFGGDS